MTEKLLTGTQSINTKKSVYVVILVLLSLDLSFLTLYIQISWLLMKPSDQDPDFSTLIECICLQNFGKLRASRIKIGDKKSKKKIINMHDKI